MTTGNTTHIMIDFIKHRIVNTSNQIQKMIVSEALNVVPGTQNVSDDIAKDRIDMCESCDQFNQETRKCAMCGCFMDVKTKIFSIPFVGEQHCDLNKW